MDKKTVEKMLEGAERKELIEIISKISASDPKSEKVIIDWCKKNNDQYRAAAVERELKNLWKRAQRIIRMFNDYGGGPEDDEEEACDILWKMDELVKKSEISWETRVVVLDEMLAEFYEGNSGFDDLLVDIAESFCKSREEKRYLADALKKSGGYYSSYAANIYRSIGDEDQFLKTKLANLRYDSDYVEIAQYYMKHKNRETAIHYVWEGLEKSSGGLEKLIDYIAPIYMKEKNDVELQRLYRFVLSTKWETNITAIAKYLYEYARKSGNYESMKQMLMLILENCQQSEMKCWFKTCKEQLTPDDWQKEYADILTKIKKKDHRFYLDICMDTGREDIVLDYIQKTNHDYDFWDIDYNQYFSGRLAKKYPEEVVEIYWRSVKNLLRVCRDKNYAAAVSLLKKIKAIRKRTKQTDKWEKEFRDLKEQHKKKRNFMTMLGDL